MAYKVVLKNSFELPQVGFTVSKSKFKLAVDRNLIKRRMRVAYRINNNEFLKKLANDNKSLVIMFVYNKRKIVDYKEIEYAIQQLLSKKF